MKKKLHVSALAERDLDTIWHYVATNSQSLNRADRFVDAIVRRLSVLAHAPKAGIQGDEVQPGLRSLPVGRYMVYYRESGKYVVVSRIIHGGREQDAAFRKESP